MFDTFIHVSILLIDLVILAHLNCTNLQRTSVYFIYLLFNQPDWSKQHLLQRGSVHNVENMPL